MPRTHMLPTLPPCRFEQLLWDNWQAHKRSTLAVVCLPLGCWVRSGGQGRPGQGARACH